MVSRSGKVIFDDRLKNERTTDGKVLLDTVATLLGRLIIGGDSMQDRILYAQAFAMALLVVSSKQHKNLGNVGIDPIEVYNHAKSKFPAEFEKILQPLFY